MRAVAFDCTLGFDIKIDPKDQPYIIEFNGKDSGIKGLTELGIQNVDNTRFLAKECLAGIQAPGFLTNYVPGGRIETEEGVYEGPHYKMTFGDAPSFITSNIHGLPKKYDLIKRCLPLETVAANKLLQKDFIDPGERGAYTVWDGRRETVELFMEQLSRQHEKDGHDLAPYVVAKSVCGSHGDDVRIFDRRDTVGVRGFFTRFSPGEALLEDFIPSKKLEEYEDGCMRYLVDFVTYVNESGEVRFKPIYSAGYWRIPPTSEGDDLNLRYKANLSGKNRARLQLASHDELHIARKAIHKSLEKLHQCSDLFRE